MRTLSSNEIEAVAGGYRGFTLDDGDQSRHWLEPDLIRHRDMSDYTWNPVGNLIRQLGGGGSDQDLEEVVVQASRDGGIDWIEGTFIGGATAGMLAGAIWGVNVGATYATGITGVLVFSEAVYAGAILGLTAGLTVAAVAVVAGLAIIALTGN